MRFNSQKSAVFNLLPLMLTKSVEFIYSKYTQVTRSQRSPRWAQYLDVTWV